MASASGTGASGDGGSVVTIHVRHPNGPKIAVATSLGATAGELKASVAEQSGEPPSRQRLFYKGRILEDGRTLGSYGLEKNHTIQLARCEDQQSLSTSLTMAKPGDPPVPSSKTAIAKDKSASKDASFEGFAFGCRVTIVSPAPVMSASSGPSFHFEFGSKGLHKDLHQTKDLNIDINNAKQCSSSNPTATKPGDLTKPSNGTLEAKDHSSSEDAVLKGFSFDFGASTGSVASGPPLFGSQGLNKMHLHPAKMLGINYAPDIQNLAVADNSDCVQSLTANDPQLHETLDDAANHGLKQETGGNTDRALGTIGSSLGKLKKSRYSDETHVEPSQTATDVSGGTRSKLSANQGAASTMCATWTSPKTDPLPNPWGSAESGKTAVVTLDRAVWANAIEELIPDQEFVKKDLPRWQKSFPTLFQGTQPSGAFKSFQGSSGPVCPERSYVAQLSQLRKMGFTDMKENIRALEAADGDVQGAIDELSKKQDPEENSHFAFSLMDYR